MILIGTINTMIPTLDGIETTVRLTVVLYQYSSAARTALYVSMEPFYVTVIRATYCTGL